MTEDQLETMIARTGSERLRAAASDDNPDADEREWARRWVVDMCAYDSWPPAPAYPSLLTQAGNAVKAAARFVASGGAIVTQAEYDRRRGICEGCPFFDAEQDRCKLCGCAISLKPWSSAEKCPDDPPRW